MTNPNISNEIQQPLKSLGKIPRILIIEDEILVGWSLVRTLKKNNYEVFVVDSGEKIFELTDLENYDLVITDVNLPRIDGFEVAAYVKSKNPGIPVIMMSALAENSAQGSTPLVVDRFVEKPFEFVEIIEVIHDLLAKKEAIVRH